MTFNEGFEIGMAVGKDIGDKEKIMDLIKSIDEEETILNGNCFYNMGFIKGLLETLR